MLGIYYLLFFIFIFQKSYAQCPQQANGVFRFGPKCGFMCHCRNNVKCDDTTGECTSGCASFWYGPGCQYRDIAEGEYSRHSDNLPHGKHKYSALANDGDKNTCSYTAEVQSSKKKVKPFWRVWFPANETIRELEIVTLNATLQYFKGFTVFVEYLSPEEKESQNASSYRRECYKHGDAAPNNATFTVLCTSPDVGNQVRIVLDELKTQLVLCDVRINGGRNLAYGRTTYQISKHRDCRKDDTCSSDKAVDGNESNYDWRQCTFTADEKDPWLKIELDHKTTIWYIRILLQKVETSTYQLEVSNATNEVGKSTYDVNATASLQINLTLNTIGESVKLTKRTTLGRLEICEVYIYGDCLEDKCGYGCGQESHCKRATIWDKMSRSCSYGCKDGWMSSGCNIRINCLNETDGDKCSGCSEHCKDGHIPCNKADGNFSKGCNDGWKGQKCDQECDDGTFGSGCSQACSGHCKNDQTCDRANGSCPNGCSKGYEGNSCNQTCPAGFYGNNCNSNCSENCVEGTCRHTDGKCTEGCTAGWKGKRCEKPCPVGFYGNNCNNKCSENCVQGTCRHKDGKCIKGCTAGWKGRRCEKQCNDGTYGPDCSMNCSGNCKNDVPCKKDDGFCPNGCNIGFRGDRCDQRCGSGQYGTNCSRKCSVNCENENECGHINGHCRCKEGWMGQTCEQECIDGTFGFKCRARCSGNCKNSEICEKIYGSCPTGCKLGYYGKLCSRRCRTSYYGINCTGKCSEHCQGGYAACSKENGNCKLGCNAGWNGEKCEQECDRGRFGQGCQYRCSENCKDDDICDTVNGECPRGCKPGYTGKTCAQNCTAGFYGDKCSHNCSGHCEGGSIMCSSTDGHCLGGCEAGWKGVKCDTGCDNGNFGPDCLNTCSLNCYEDDICDKVHGQCPRGCKPGFTGKTCGQNCKIGFFGPKCSHNCSDHCEGGSKMCANTDGHCLDGCAAGWKGAKCDTECDGGFYGINCSMTCGNCKSGTACHKVAGTCSEGCESDYSGDNCLQAMQKSNNSVAITAGGVAALVVFMVIAAAIIVVIYRKRKKPGQRKNDDSANIEFTDAVSSGRREKDRQKRCNNMHLNAAAAANAETNRSSTSGVNTYNNDSSVSQTKHTIPLSNLLAYVKRNLANSDYFSKEFQELPYGMKYPSTVGANPYNRKKNRYKDMQAYNHTRVMLKTLPKEQGSDYINASFIKGHAKEKAYIAAQGPTEATIDDFWRMIWEKNVYTIAMVTNLVEETKTKCLQYWPTVESSTRYGDFIVCMESEAIFAEFTIRNLKVDFEEGKPSRTITQFHFTAWPDHSVPRSTSGLLQFWRKVRNNDAIKAHSWLVHCSAGVGRTGTFIATDILYDQGKDKGYVDVYQCVRDLRDQRVNMVQTKDQYLFLHGLMTEAFILPSEPVPLEHFHQVVNDLKDVDKVARKTKLLLQYETLKEDMTYMFTKDETEEKYSAAMLKENRTKNRNNSILPPNEFRPFLATAIAGCTNYINAVYIPSYCDIHGYIITQTPLESTAIDCCRLVYEQEVKVIVTFPAKVKEQNGTYLPEDGTVNLGPFTVAKTSEEDKHFYKKKTFVMAYDSEECELTQLVFNNWPVNRITPSDPLNMLNFMQEVEFHRRIADNKPVLVQCLDGSEKSGLFVVLMNILERARLDNEVSIPQVIRQLRIRRQQIIPNFEQFKFCHDVLLCHVDSNAMYANM